jgi:hypothetical protein
MSYQSPYEYMSPIQPPPPYGIGDAAGSEKKELSLIKINENIEPKQENYYSTWRGVLAGISTFTIFEIFRNFFF